MAKIKTTRWDPVDYLDDDAALLEYLEAALEDGDSAVVTAALGDIARAKGMATVAEMTGLGRESLYKALSRTGNPELSTVLKVVKALGLRLRAEPAVRRRRRPTRR
jgi:probable addiction module antidote protein